MMTADEVIDKASGLCSDIYQLCCMIRDARGGVAPSFSLAESCTGGLVASMLTSTAGISAFFPGGVVSYCDTAKHELLLVSERVLSEHGAVSPQCALQMAQGAMSVFHTDLAVSITGFAGPGGGTGDAPTGTVWFGSCASGARPVMVRTFRPDAGRHEIQLFAAVTALKLIRRRLEDIK